MKLKHLFLPLLFATIAFPACDKISNPLLPTLQNSLLPNRKPDFEDSSATSGPYTYKQYKLLLEDCMGDQCSNCPAAVAIADTLISPTGNPTHYGQVVMMEENMGFDATPNTAVAGAPSYAFATNYTSIIGNFWNQKYFPFIAYPAGMINRRDWTSGSPLLVDQNYNAWKDTVNTLLGSNSQPVIYIDIFDSCWVKERIIVADFKLTGLTSLPTLPAGSTYNLITLIVESPIISWQEDEFVAGGFDPTFSHTNVLRGAFGNNQGGLTGGVVIPDSVVYNQRTWTSRQTYDFTHGENGNAGGIGNSNGPEWNMANCYIVAFVYNTNTLEVLQTEMIKIE